MRTGRGIVAAISLLTATLGACAEGDPGVHDVIKREYDSHQLVHKDPEEVTISDEQERELYDTYAQIVTWSGGKVTARLVIIEGREEFVCTDAIATQYMVTSLNSPRYCAQPNAVVMTAAWVSDTAPSIDPRNRDVEDAANAWVLTHEVGHSMELQTLAQLDRVDGVTRELGADCFAGTFIGDMVRSREYGQETVKNVVTVLETLPEDPAHGTARQRADSFTRGVNGGDCTAVTS